MQPQHRISYGRKRRRQAHSALKPTQAVICPNCGESKMPHTVCEKCGYVRPGLQLKVATAEEA